MMMMVVKMDQMVAAHTSGIVTTPKVKSMMLLMNQRHSRLQSMVLPPKGPLDIMNHHPSRL